ncbi:MAG: DUF308 domain-containing protein [Clostridia bacterium]|nr:DUF308 domain-containing protein [Clostridia bacterium]
MKELLKKFAKSSLVISLALIILALFLIFKPTESLNFIVIVVGIILAIVGLIHTISYFSASKEFKSLSFELIQGIVLISVGIIFIIKPNLINEFLASLVGAWIIIQSIIRFQFAFNLKAIENKNWSLMLILSIVTFILGIIIIFNPFATLVAVTTISGVMLLISEIINVLESISLLRL